MRSSNGNISVRLDESRFLITPSGGYKLLTQPEDLVIIDWEGNVLEGAPGLRPSSEYRIHIEAYRQRADIRAALHAHPPYAIALTLADIPFPADLVPEAAVALGQVPTIPYERPGTDTLAHSIHEAIRESNAVLLSHHGSLTVGATLQEALVTLERLEHVVHMFYIARTLGEVHPLPPDEAARLWEEGRRRFSP
jgi:L-fuculose-phosphate aldolase